MARTLPPLNALRAFEAAGRHQSFSRAAVELNVSHSAISRHVRGLEDRLGTQLFRDAAPGVALTSEGQAYLARISPALDDISEATEEVGEAPAGRVLINADTLFAQQILIPNIGTFWNANPDIELRIVASHTLADLNRYEADFAIRFSRNSTMGLPADLLCDAPLFPYATPGYFASIPSTQDILAARRVQDRPPEVWQRWADAAGADVGNLEIASWRLRAPLALNAACSGAAVYLGSADCVNDFCREGRLQRLSPHPLREGAFFIVTKETRLRSKALRIVRNWVLDITAPLRVKRFWEFDQPIG
ncbi:MAG: LysR family transcriptional regulator [Paracoccaceae bacterium]